MIVIRSAEDMSRLLDTSLDPDLRSILQEHLDRMDGYDLAELARLVICLPDDALTDIERECGWSLLDGQQFANQPDVYHQLGGWADCVFILSDDGFGVILIVAMTKGTDQTLLLACNNEAGRA